MINQVFSTATYDWPRDADVDQILEVLGSTVGKEMFQGASVMARKSGERARKVNLGKLPSLDCYESIESIDGALLGFFYINKKAVDLRVASFSMSINDVVRNVATIEGLVQSLVKKGFGGYSIGMTASSHLAAWREFLAITYGVPLSSLEAEAATIRSRFFRELSKSDALYREYNREKIRGIYELNILNRQQVLGICQELDAQGSSLDCSSFQAINDSWSMLRLDAMAAGAINRRLVGTNLII